MEKNIHIPTGSRLEINRIRASIDGVLSAIRQGFDALLTAWRRTDEIERLTAKSGSELAEMGLRRDDIPRHVFRDLLHH